MIAKCRGNARHPAPLFASAIVLLSLLCCCSGPHEDTSDPYASQIAAARQKATSDFERQVLEDGVITRAEYEEANQRLVACAKSRGVDIGLHDQSGYYIYSVQNYDANERIVQDCQTGTTALIGPLYVDMLINPKKQDIHELIAECLVASGLAPTGFSKTDFDQGLQKQRDHSGSPFPFDMSDPRFEQCMANPSSGAETSATQ